MRDQLWPTGKWWHYTAFESNAPIPESRSEHRDLAVLSTWENLGNVREWNATTLADILYLHIETPFVERICAAPLNIGANTAMDIRPWLSDREAIGKLFRLLAVHWTEAVNQLRWEKRISRLAFEKLSNQAPTQDRCFDPYALVHFGHLADVEKLTWKETEVRSSFAFFRGGSIRQVRQAMKVVDSILLSDSASSTSLLRFLVGANFCCAASWVRLLQLFPEPRHQQHFLERLGQSSAKSHSPDKELDRLFHKVAKRGQRHDRSALELAGLFQIVEKKIKPKAFEDMIELSTAITQCDAWIDLPKKISGLPELKPLIEVGRRLVAEEGNRRQQRYNSACNRILRLWKASLQSAPLRKIIANQVWEEFPEPLTSNLLNMILRIHEITSSAAQFREVLNHNLEEIRKQASERQSIRLRTSLHYLNWISRFTSLHLQRSFDRYANTVAEGFDKFPGQATELYLEMHRRPNSNQRWAIEGISRSAIKHMDQVARSHRTESLIVAAIPSFFRALPDIDFSTFFRQPRQFLKMLCKLGKISESDRFDTIAIFNSHPALLVDPIRIGLRGACLLLIQFLQQVSQTLFRASCANLPVVEPS